MTQDVTSPLTDILEANFAYLARLHDKLLGDTVAHISKATDHNGKVRDDLENLMAQTGSAQCRVVKSVMELRFPEAAAVWFR